MIDKIAQRRTILDKIREPSRRGLDNKLLEKVNMTGKFKEVMSPEMGRIMEDVRLTDDTLRSILAGENIGASSDWNPDGFQMKEVLKSAKSNFNRREYLTVVAELSKAHLKFQEINKVLKQLDLKVNKVHHEMLLNGLGDEHKEHLLSLKQRFANLQKVELVKEAGAMGYIADFLTNIGTKRGRALAAWEKQYPQEVNKLKNATSGSLREAIRCYEVTISSLKEMATSRSWRDPDRYMKSAKTIMKACQNFDRLFRTYYQDHVKTFLEEIEAIQQTQEKSIPVVDKAVEQVTNQKPIEQIVYPDPLPSKTTEVGQVEVTQPMAGSLNSIRQDEPNTESAGESKKAQILNQLESFAGESPEVVKLYIKKYAKQLESIDPITSLQLFNLIK